MRVSTANPTDEKVGVNAASQHPNECNTSLDQEQSTKQASTWRRIWNTINYVPPKVRWDPNAPPKFTLALNILFGFAGAFTVANLYYSHPILNILAHDFDVPYVKVAQIPTLAQAGYAVGLLFLCPLGDLLRRRPFVLWLVLFTSTVSIGLAVTKSIEVFSAIQFLTGVTTVTPQLMLPLVGDLAPAHRRASAMSIVVSGLMLGILIARLLSGIMAQYTSWRNIYWLSVACQYAIFILLWIFMPDYPSVNPGMSYPKILWSIVVMCFKHPIIIQSCLIAFFGSAVFTNFWTTLTFLLSGDPYNYTPVTIGLFALIGIVSMICGPLWARHITDRFVPLFSVLLGLIWMLTGIALGTYTGTFTVAGPILQAALMDFGMQTSQIANRAALMVVEPKGRNRVNTAFMVFTFAGQLVGTSVGARLYARGGWIASGSYSMGSVGAALLIAFARGPWEKRWLGWRGGWAIRKKGREGEMAKAMDTVREEKSGGLSTMREPDVESGKDVVGVRDDVEVVDNVDLEKTLEMMGDEDGDEKASTLTKKDASRWRIELSNVD
ncbi:Hypothetical protein R9X50_00217200 [Acrodontium crateriforme]|uniref:Major facilitator superfamily (MFS) profile domain-containing protein n=1 Tax=Acrodontium crateriforme TaxID=150365 RepID=A0AAQ3M0G5_9PEZI|nr:Hypothetical protein R9X50_00217200 [Acrodontium crateriforme]